MSTLSTILAVVLGLVFVAVGIPKLTGQEAIVENFRRWGYADVIRTATGSMEIVAGLMLLGGIAVQSLAVSGSIIIMIIMIGALATHQHAHDPIKDWIPAATLLVLDLALAVSLLPQ
jgi:putative oxidoreductase